MSFVGACLIMAFWFLYCWLGGIPWVFAIFLLPMGAVAMYWFGKYRRCLREVGN
jgi:hypothetical protein